MIARTMQGSAIDFSQLIHWQRYRNRFRCVFIQWYKHFVEVDLFVMRNLHKQIRTTDNILCVLDAESGECVFDAFANACEQIDERLCGLLKITRNKMFDAISRRFFCCFKLSRDARMTCAKLTVSTNGASNRDHG